MTDLHPLDDPVGRLLKPFLEEETEVRMRQFTEQNIIGVLKEAEAGVAVKDLCRKDGLSDAALHRLTRTVHRGNL